MSILNLRLICLIFCGLLCAVSTVRAQDVPQNPPALPPEPVEKKLLFEENTPVFIELFSSQACVFCPQADRLFADLLTQENIIGLSCHVDYFKVKQGSLSQPFCTERQNWYMKALQAGPNYTPQMVINGRYDVVGYKMDDVIDTLKTAQQDNLIILAITINNAVGTYSITLPEIKTAQEQPAKIWLALYDDIHDITIADGRNQGKTMPYQNIVSIFTELSPWDGKETIRNFSLPDAKDKKGFVILVQNEQSGALLAVGHYQFPPATPEN